MEPERNSFLVKGYVHDELTNYFKDYKKPVFCVEEWYLIFRSSYPLFKTSTSRRYSGELRCLWEKLILACQIISILMGKQ